MGSLRLCWAIQSPTQCTRIKLCHIVLRPIFRSTLLRMMTGIHLELIIVVGRCNCISHVTLDSFVLPITLLITTIKGIDDASQFQLLDPWDGTSLQGNSVEHPRHLLRSAIFDVSSTIYEFHELPKQSQLYYPQVQSRQSWNPAFPLSCSLACQ